MKNWPKTFQKIKLQLWNFIDLGPLNLELPLALATFVRLTLVQVQNVLPFLLILVIRELEADLVLEIPRTLDRMTEDPVPGGAGHKSGVRCDPRS